VLTCVYADKHFADMVFISLGLLVVYLIYLQAVDKNLTQ